MRIGATFFTLVLVPSIAIAEIRPEAEVRLGELTSSLALGVGYASGWTADDIAKMVPEFEGSNAFEDRRLRTEAVNNAQTVGERFKNSGFPQLVYRIGRIDFGEYSFRDKKYRVCMPWYGGATIDDIPTNGISIEFSLGKNHVASHAAYTNSGENCGKWTLDGLTIWTAPFELVIPDDATAERLFNEVQRDNGKISAAIVCNFDRLEQTMPGPGGRLFCSYEGLYLSFGSEGFDPNRVFYLDQVDPTTKEQHQELVFK